jgi:circadian clock protein KaiC
MGRSVFYEALGPQVRAGGFSAVLKRVDADIKAHRPGLLAIDSFRALAAYGDAREYRSFLADLSDLLSAFPLSAFWIGEYTADDISRAPEFAVTDSVICLSREDAGVREFRYLQILKLRGSGFLSGKHACRISSSGLDVFPRLADRAIAVGYAPGVGRTPLGIPAVDALIEDGFLAGSSTLVAGPAGTGKTLTGMHFIFSGARAGEPGLIASFQENPGQLAGILAPFGWSLDEDNVHHLYQSAVDLYIDEWMSILLERVERLGVRRLLVDSVGDLEMVAADRTRFREFVYSFTQRCTRAGVSLMLTIEVPELFQVRRLTNDTFSHLADNVVLLQYVHHDTSIKRALSVVKSRGTRHDPRVHEFDITTDGIVLGEPIVVRPDGPG